MPISKHFSGELHHRCAQDLQLAGFAQRTCKGYLREIRKLADHCGCAPDRISESQNRKYFLYLKNEKHFAEGSLRVSLSAFKFFYRTTCPHAHFVVPGGGVNEATGVWQQTPENFFLPHAALAKVYKAKFADHLRASGLYDRVDASAWKPQWTVDIQPVAGGGATLKYLAAYVHRVGISDKRIVANDSTGVTFRYTPSGEKQSRKRTVAGSEFVRGIVQHTLPSRFQKIRYYGWQSPNSRIDQEEVRWLVMLSLGLAFCLWAYGKPQASQPLRRCSKCGGQLRTMLVTDADGNVLYQNGLGYLDSG